MTYNVVKFVLIIALLLILTRSSKSLKSCRSFIKCNRFSMPTYLLASVNSYIEEARQILSSDISDTEIMKLAIYLSIKENEKVTALMEKDKIAALMEKDKEIELLLLDKATALSIKDNFYLKKLSILSLRYHHIY